MKTQFLMTLIAVTVFSFSALAGPKGGSRRGGNSDGGGGPDTVAAGALKLLIEGGGLKKAMLNYLNTIDVDKIEDKEVQKTVAPLISSLALQNDIRTLNNYYLATPGEECRDAYGKDVPASTRVGAVNSRVCFDLDKLVESYRTLNEEEVMIRLASLAFHEHIHHFQTPSEGHIKKNEDEANLVAGYILVTAKFVQIPMLQWSPGEDEDELEQIKKMFDAIRAREKRFLQPREEDYVNYPGYKDLTDRGLIRLLPHAKYNGKLSIQGSGAYYSFVNLKHDYGYGSDLKLDRGYLSVGFAGCDYGMMTKLGQESLSDVSMDTAALSDLATFKPDHDAEPKVRVQQRAALDGHLKINGREYSGTLDDMLVVGNTYALRSINFGYSDILVAFTVVRIDKDGSVILAWKMLKRYPTISCGK